MSFYFPTYKRLNKKLHLQICLGVNMSDSKGSDSVPASQPDAKDDLNSVLRKLWFAGKGNSDGSITYGGNTYDPVYGKYWEWSLRNDPKAGTNNQPWTGMPGWDMPISTNTSGVWDTISRWPMSKREQALYAGSYRRRRRRYFLY